MATTNQTTVDGFLKENNVGIRERPFTSVTAIKKIPLAQLVYDLGLDYDTIHYYITTYKGIK